MYVHVCNTKDMTCLTVFSYLYNVCKYVCFVLCNCAFIIITYL